MNNPIEPVMVDSGPCRKNIATGDKIDPWIFPVPRPHHLDVGKYIGTLGVVITKDPETPIKDVYVTEMGCAGHMVIVSMDQHFYLRNVRQIIYTVFLSIFISKWCIVVDDDVDIYD